MIVRSTCQRSPRRGLSLLEVIVALAIFLMSLVAISQLIEQGADMAVKMDDRSYASMLAQRKLAEVIAGSEPLTGHGDIPFEDDDSDWSWSLGADLDSIANLYKVVVTVHKDTPRGKVEIVFSQYVLDPTKRGSTDATAIGTDDAAATGAAGSTTGGSP
jgi:general secretion pathway protein I